MKKDLMEILVCPVCKGTLKVDIAEEKEGEIIAGSLFCKKCNYTYHIKDAIPNLLPPGLEG